MSQPFIETDKGNYYLHERLRVTYKTNRSFCPSKAVGELIVINPDKEEIVLYNRFGGGHKSIPIRFIEDITVIPKYLSSKRHRELAMSEVASEIKDIERRQKHNIYLKNKVKYKAYAKEYYDKHRDIISENSKKYYLKNKEKMNAYSRNYYLKHKAKILKYSKEYYKNKKR